MICCSVCKTRLSSAFENQGSFSVPSSFGERITDTCERCAEVLREAVAAAVVKLRKKQKVR